MEIVMKYLLFLALGLGVCSFFWRNRLLIRVYLFLTVLCLGYQWHRAIVELRERPERAMARIVQIQRPERDPFRKSWQQDKGCTLDVVFRDSQGERREVQGMYHLSASRCSQENIGTSVEIAYAAHAPEQAMPASDDARSLFKFLFFFFLVLFLSSFFLNLQRKSE
jgi:hypothetical protein